MQARGLTVVGLSKGTNGRLSVRSLCRWRSGEATPNALALPILTDALNVGTDWLLGVSDYGGPDDA